MSEPRLFYLGRKPCELPPGWRGIEATEEWAIEVAPGVRVSLTGTGDFLLPDGRVAWGAGIAVWTDEPLAEVEWGVRFTIGGVNERPLASEEEARTVVANMRENRPEFDAVLITRTPEVPAGPWRLAEEPATGETREGNG
jgi:hypothetical protein